MAYNSNNSFSGVVSAFRRLSILTAFALAVFAFASAVHLGIAGDIISWMETYKLAPFALTGFSLAVIFASSSTRDPRYYHPVEWGIVFTSLAAMAVTTFLSEAESIVASHEPWSQAVLFVLYALAAAIVAR